MIEELNSSELHIIEDLAKIIWPVSFKSMISQKQIEYMLEWMYNQKKLQENHQNGHKYVVYKEKDTFLGFISYEIKKNKSNIRIHKLYVHHEQQKKGIGIALLNYAIDLGRENRMTQLDLFVNRTNPAVHFYKKIGFSIVEEIDLDIGNGYFMNDYRMKLKI